MFSWLAICLTVTVPVLGNRARDARNRFRLPEGIEMANFRGLTQARMPDAAGSGLAALAGREFDRSLGWDALEWLRSRPGWSELEAVREGRVLEVDGELFGRPGPRIGTAVLTLARWLHPEAFEGAADA